MKKKEGRETKTNNNNTQSFTDHKQAEMKKWKKVLIGVMQRTTRKIRRLRPEGEIIWIAKKDDGTSKRWSRFNKIARKRIPNYWCLGKQQRKRMEAIQDIVSRKTKEEDNQSQKERKMPEDKGLRRKNREPTLKGTTDTEKRRGRKAILIIANKRFKKERRNFTNNNKETVIWFLTIERRPLVEIAGQIPNQKIIKELHPDEKIVIILGDKDIKRGERKERRAQNHKDKKGSKISDSKNKNYKQVHFSTEVDDLSTDKTKKHRKNEGAANNDASLDGNGREGKHNHHSMRSNKSVQKFRDKRHIEMPENGSRKN